MLLIQWLEVGTKTKVGTKTWKWMWTKSSISQLATLCLVCQLKVHNLDGVYFLCLLGKSLLYVSLTSWRLLLMNCVDRRSFIILHTFISNYISSYHVIIFYWSGCKVEHGTYVLGQVQSIQFKMRRDSICWDKRLEFKPWMWYHFEFSWGVKLVYTIFL